VGGARDPQALESDDPSLIARTHEALAGILGLRGRPVLTHVQRHPRAMPHYRVGDAERIDSIQVRWPSGETEVFPGGAVDRQVEVRRGEGRKP
jgi:protoporphyrinogen oxidase